MCGLSGCAGDVSTKEEKLFRDLLIFSSVRGTDSTGAGCVSRNSMAGDKRQMKLAKCSGPFPNLFDRKSFDKLFHGVNCCYIGHNRFKTVGDSTDRNAHPFQFPEILGAHNGTLDRSNKNRLEAGDQFETDSEALFNTIQIHGIEETISRIDNTEAYALTWYDLKDHTLNFLRNDKRPFYYTFINKGKTIVWASENELLQAAIYRNNFSPDDKKIFELPENIWMSFKIPNTLEAFGAPTRKKLEGRVPKYAVKKTQTTTYHGGTSNRSGTNYSIFDDDTLEDMEYGGHFVGYVPKQKEPIKDVVVTEVEKTNVVALPPPKSPKVLDAEDMKRLRSFGDLARKGEVPNQNQTTLFYNGDTCKIYRRYQDGVWIILKYNNDPKNPEWEREEVDIPPKELPYTILDINARHQFKHVGRKKHKRIYYKGYAGKYLDRDEFEMYMQGGCMGCGRSPEWGNEVAFITDQHDFLCEFCSLTPGLLTGLYELNRKKVIN